MIDVHTYTFHNAKAEIYKFTNEEWHPYPWTFRIQNLENKNKWHNFAGIPNKCHSLKSAMMRAKWRCKWLADGSFYEKYK